MKRSFAVASPKTLSRSAPAWLTLAAACSISGSDVRGASPPLPASSPVVAAGPPALLTQRGDASRSGANTSERVLSPATVGPASFGKLFARTVDGDVYAQPLYVQGVPFAGGPRNVLVVATEHDTVYAFDADDPDASAPLWSASIGLSTPVPNPWFAIPTNADDCRNASFNMRESGITSTPVVDPDSGTVYVVGLVRDPIATTEYPDCVDVESASPSYCVADACTGPVFRYELHALDLVTGAERPGSPATIEGSVQGTGDGSDGKSVAFDPRIHLQRPGLLLANGRVYAAFGSYGDLGAYHGWIFAYDAKTLARAAVMCTTPDGSAGSIWQSGVGLAADEDGFVYAATSNGTLDADGGGRDYGDAVLKLDADLHVVDWFAPYLASLGVVDYLSMWDADLGSGGVVLFPSLHKLVVAGKRGVLYVLDRDDLGHLEAPVGAAREVERVVAWAPGQTCDPRGTGSGVYGGPVLWSGPTGARLFVWGVHDVAKSFPFLGGAIPAGATCFCTAHDAFPDDPPCAVAVSAGSEIAVADVPGAIFGVSSDGAKPGTGIFWAVRAAEDGSTTDGYVTGVLEAYAADDLGRKLWTSRGKAIDALGTFAKFTPPVVANGKVYVATMSGSVVAYGLVDRTALATPP